MCAQTTVNCPMGDDCCCPNTSCENFGKCCQCIKAHRAGGSPVYCMEKLMKRK